MLFGRWQLVLLGCLVLASLGVYWALHGDSVVATQSADHRPASIQQPAIALPGDKGSETAIQTRVHGTVKSAKGDPIAAATVCLIRNPESTATALAAWATLECVLSDDRGAFELKPVAAADYVVTASAPGYRAAGRKLNELDAHAEPGLSDVELVLEGGGVQVSGVVVDATGGPISGAIVLVKIAGATSPIGTETQAEGRFTVFVDPGPVEIFARAEGYSRAQIEAVAACDNLRLTLAPGSTIVGKVVRRDSGQPVAGVSVVASRTRGFELYDKGSAESDSAGEFRIAGLAPGEYAVSPQSKHWSGEPTNVMVEPLETSRSVVLYITAAASLEGELRVGHEPCRQGFVRIFDTQAERIEQPDATGVVHFEGVKPGRYSVTASCNGAVSKNSSIDIVAGDNPRCSWDLETGLSIKGTVVTAGGKPRSGVHVLVRSTKDLASFPVRCVSGDGGRFECSGLTADTFECLATDDSGLAMSDSVQVTVQSGATSPIVVRLRAAGTIRVLVRSAAGKPRGNTLLFAKPERAPARPIPRRGEGEYVLENLVLGTYQVVEGFPSADQRGETVHLSAADQVVTVQLVASPTAGLNGRVVDYQGHPVADAWVRVVVPPISSEGGVSPVLTDAEGAFELSGLLSGRTYKITAENFSGEAVKNDVAPGTHVTLQLQRYASVSGFVRDSAGKAIQDFTITCQDALGSTGRTFTNPEGAWQMASLSPGSWTIRATSSSGEATQSVDLAGGSDTQVVLTVQAVSTADEPQSGLAPNALTLSAPRQGGGS